MSAKPYDWKAVTQEQRDRINAQRRNRRLIRFRNCYCHDQATRVMDGTFLCERHFRMERERIFQPPDETAANIRESNARSEKNRYAKLKAAGLCVTCGQRKQKTGCVRCDVCQSKRLASRAANRLESPSGEHPWKVAKRADFARNRTTPTPLP